MDTKKLRQKILDLAIHGKLVPQDPNDEPASVLLERIRAEKERLVKEGKIKKSKSSKTTDTPHYENRQVGEANVPFEIPCSWEWVKFGIVCKKLTDGSHNPPPKKPIGYTVISAQNIKKGQIVFTEKDRYTDDIGFNKENPRTKISKGDIILGIIGGSIGNVGIFNHDKPVIAQRSVSIIDSYVFNLYCFYLLQSPIFQSLFVEKSIGNAQAGVYLGELEKLIIPLPPLAEQIRIVAEIERWFIFIDQIEQGKVDLQTTIKQTKSKILDLAIHGKLVSQDPNDEPAFELLKRINPKAEITCDIGQYGKIPDGWCLCRLGDIGEIVTGNTPTKDIAEYYGGNIPFYKPADLEEGKFIKNASDNLSVLGFEQARKIPANSILVTCIGATIGKTGLIIVEGSCNQQINAIIPNEAAYAEFIYYTCISDYMQKKIKSNASATTLPILNKGNFAKLPFPLPPYNEQHRIVAKIEELFSSLDNIQKALEV